MDAILETAHLSHWRLSSRKSSLFLPLLWQASPLTLDGMIRVISLAHRNTIYLSLRILRGCFPAATAARAQQEIFLSFQRAQVGGKRAIRSQCHTLRGKDEVYRNHYHFHRWF